MRRGESRDSKLNSQIPTSKSQGGSGEQRGSTDSPRDLGVGIWELGVDPTHLKLTTYSRPPTSGARTVSSGALTIFIVVPPAEIRAILCPFGGLIARSPSTSGRSRTSVAFPPVHLISTVTAPRARRPAI